MLNIIFLADIVGKIGRKAVAKELPKLRKKYKPDLVIANVENLAHGIGFTKNTLEEMTEAGVDFFTSGNHAWKKAGSDDILDDKDINIIRPANYRAKKSGVGFKEIKIGSNSVIVVNLLGEVFIEHKLEETLTNPFVKLDEITRKVGKNKIIILDFHAEATSEKVAMGHYANGKVSAVIGTHTHVMTADEKILSKGTGYISDAGMVGYYDSVIGAEKETIINMFVKSSQGSKKHDLPEIGKCEFNAIYLEIDEKDKKTKKIKRLNKIVNI